MPVGVETVLSCDLHPGLFSVPKDGSVGFASRKAPVGVQGATRPTSNRSARAIIAVQFPAASRGCTHPCPHMSGSLKLIKYLRGAFSNLKNAQTTRKFRFETLLVDLLVDL